MVGSASKAYRDYGSDQPIKPLSQVLARGLGQGVMVLGEKTFLLYHPVLQCSNTPNIQYEAIAVKRSFSFPAMRDRNSDTFNLSTASRQWSIVNKMPDPKG